MPYDAVSTTSRTVFLAGQPVGERGAGQADARPQLEDVDRPERLAEDVDPTAGGMEVGRGELQQCRLAGAVGPEHDPSLALADVPADGVEQRRAVSADADTGRNAGRRTCPATYRPDDR